MRVSFLSPEAALVGLVALLALGALVAGRRRSERACAALALAPPRTRSLVLDAGALVALGALLALAAAQPVVSSLTVVEGRTDAEAIVVVDITRSMLARGQGQPTRLERARAYAKEFRSRLPAVPVGVASLSDRALPHLFPSLSANAFAATVDRAIGIERPPPDRRTRTRATSFAALTDLPRMNFFGPRASRRIAIFLTDGETLAVDLNGLREAFVGGRVQLVLVHVWRAGERVYVARGDAERYRPDPTSRATLSRMATAVEGAAFTEREIDAALADVRSRLGEGPVDARGEELAGVALGPAVAAAAFLPLMVLLARRNF